MLDIEIRYYCRRCAKFTDESYSIKNNFICPNCNYKLTKYELEIDSDTGRRLTKPDDITLEIANGEEFDWKYCSENKLKEIKELQQKSNYPRADKKHMFKYCPKCGYVGSQYETFLYDQQCDICENPLQYVGFDSIDNDELGNFMAKNVRPYLNHAAVKKMMKTHTDNAKALLGTPPEVRCPKCSSTQIQAVTRKWSLLTGFLTNKVDRVCLNCKTKF